MEFAVLGFVLWLLLVIGVVVFRYLTAEDINGCKNRRMGRPDGSYWGVYDETRPLDPAEKKFAIQSSPDSPD
jgi:hypothetical protein